MKPTRVYRALPRRLRQRPLLIVGCGDVGQRIGRQLAARGLRVIGTVRTSARATVAAGMGRKARGINGDKGAASHCARRSPVRAG